MSQLSLTSTLALVTSEDPVWLSISSATNILRTISKLYEPNALQVTVSTNSAGDALIKLEMDGKVVYITDMVNGFAPTSGE